VQSGRSPPTFRKKALPPSSGSRIMKQETGKKRMVLFGLLFDLEEFLRNVGRLLPDYTVLERRR
jgi:hypothetical protein